MSQEATTENTEAVSLMDHLKRIEKEAENLQMALISRNAATIMEAVTRQREALDLVQVYVETNNPQKKISSIEHRLSVQPLMKRVRKLLARNERMARTFLSVIDRTLENLSSTARGPARVYNGYGKMAGHASPLLINHVG